jgi:hypothetical protein
MHTRPLSLSVLMTSVVLGCSRTDLLESPVTTSGEGADGGSLNSLVADAGATQEEAGMPADPSSPDGAAMGTSVATGGCPASLPASGSPCTPNGIDECEYGSDPQCTTIASCDLGNDSFVWNVSSPIWSLCGVNSPQCLPSYGTPADAAGCPVDAAACLYPQGVCGCAPECGGWVCAPYPLPTGCPEPRPLLGSPCTQEGQNCAYGDICSVLAFAGPLMVCASGFWRDGGYSGCPAPLTCSP